MTRVLFTPAGSGMVITGIKALRAASEEVTILATDVDELAAGLHLADEQIIIPRFDDPSFFETFYSVIEEYDVDAVIPAFDPVLVEFAERSEEIEELGADVVTQPAETVAICRDKWRTYQRLSGKLPFPDSASTVEEFEWNSECFIKPRRGSGSEDAYHVETKEGLSYLYDRIEEPIIQEHLPGTEYTVDCFATDAGELLACVPRKRLEMMDGASSKLEVVRNPALRDMAETLVSELSFGGPFFFQAREDTEGTPRIVEIGPRTGGTMCHYFAEPNFHSLALRQSRGETLPEPDIAYGTRMTRFFEEIVL